MFHLNTKIIEMVNIFNNIKCETNCKYSKLYYKINISKYFKIINMKIIK